MEIGTFRTTDGLALTYRKWPGETERRRCAVAVLHGYAEHSGRYDRLAARLCPIGCAVYACDLRGHGRSPGPRGYISNFTDYLRDAEGLVRTVRTAEPDLPFFLLGHSMGGLIAIRFAQDRPAEVPALILSSPFLAVKMAVPPWKQAAAGLLSVVAPGLGMPNDIPVHLISHDSELVEHTRRDPLNHHVATPRWYTETLKAQKRALEHAPAIAAPLSVLYAGDDRIADPAVTERFLEGVASHSLFSRRYPGLFHEIFNEADNENVFSDLESRIFEYC